MLSAAQSAALRHVEATAEMGEAKALLSIAGAFKRAGYGMEIYHQAIESIRQHARIALHFHPDRLGHKDVGVAESLLSEGVYRNQFETGLSSGSPTAFPGGERDLWEGALFGEAYHADAAGRLELRTAASISTPEPQEVWQRFSVSLSTYRRNARAAHAIILLRTKTALYYAVWVWARATRCRDRWISWY